MNETTPSTTPAHDIAKRLRHQYDAAFKQSAVAHCQRHGGDVQRSAREMSRRGNPYDNAACLPG